MDSFRKPFRAVPIQLGEEARARQRQEQRRRSIGTTITMAIVALAVFIVGMIVTNFATVSSYLPAGLFNAAAGDRPVLVYFPNCSAARATGHAPLRAGSPGYRIGLDADGDGIACEPYMDK
jgi:hypothetical protein